MVWEVAVSSRIVALNNSNRVVVVETMEGGSPWQERRPQQHHQNLVTDHGNFLLVQGGVQAGNNQQFQQGNPQGLQHQGQGVRKVQQGGGVRFNPLQQFQPNRRNKHQPYQNVNLNQHKQLQSQNQ